MTAERQSVRFLKEFGLLANKEDVNDSFFPDGGIGFLEEMVAEVKENHLLLKIRLDSQGAYRGAKDTPIEQWMSADPAQYFPCQFVVSDACLTNCSSIWLSKHFYL